AADGCRSLRSAVGARPRRAATDGERAAHGRRSAAARRRLSRAARARRGIPDVDRPRGEGARASGVRPHRHRAVAALHVRAGLRMARSTKRQVGPMAAAQVLDAPESTLLDVLDHLLNKGVMLNGDVTLGVAGIDLIYLRLSSILCAADRVLPPAPSPREGRPRRRRPRVLKTRR